jgi:hypothetical protein
MNANLKTKEPVSAQFKTVEIDKDTVFINNIARELRQHAGNLRYTFKDENTYKSITDFFVISMVIGHVALIGKNMDLVKMHVLSISVKS